ncbi:MAG: ABC transporter permease [Pseudomonadota bacterium]
MVALARKSLLYEWRRYLPAAIAVGLAGVLLFAQAALVLGIFATAGVFVRASTADLWVGYPQTPSVDLGRPVSALAEMRLRMQPGVAQVDALHWLDASWLAPGSRKRVAVVVAGINLAPDGLLFAHVLTAKARAQLLEPGAIAVDPADLSKLDITVGQYGYIEGHRVKVVGLVPGLRGLGAVTVIASQDTARWLAASATLGSNATYYLARLGVGADPVQARQQLQATASQGRFEVWTAPEFARRTTLFWLFDTGAGLGFIAASLLVFAVGAVIASQALSAAIAGSLREFAMLRALGVARKELAAIILTQASWLGGTGLLLATLVCAVVVMLARAADVPIAPSAAIAALCATGVMLVAWFAGLASLMRLAQCEPATLLRA